MGRSLKIVQYHVKKLKNKVLYQYVSNKKLYQVLLLFILNY